jgi:hypothetical protein
MKKTTKLSSLVLAAAAFVSAFGGPALAKAEMCVQEDQTVLAVGVDDHDGTIWVRTSGGAGTARTSYPCTGNANIHYSFRFKASSTDADAILSILLAAKLSGGKVRIDKSAAGDSDTAYRAYLQ